MERRRDNCGLFETPYYIGKSEVSMARRLQDKAHPARRFWKYRDTTCALWIPTESPIDDFERALILTCGYSMNATQCAPRRYVHWEEPVLVDIRRLEHVLDCPGVYALLGGTWAEQPAFRAAEDVHHEMCRHGLVDHGGLRG